MGVPRELETASSGRTLFVRRGAQNHGMETCEVMAPMSVPDRPRRVRRAFAAAARWIGWWAASGLVVTALLMAYLMVRTKSLERGTVEFCLAFAVPGTLLGLLLWRRRRDRDGAIAAIILTSALWAALWILFWKST